MDSPLPPLVAARYRPIRELGRGGMGAVYLVEHTHTGERFALKLLLGNLGANPQAVERFKMEARASARIGSENVVRMIDAGVAPELGDALYLVMELLDGQDLDKLVLTRGPFPPAEVVSMLSQAARALDRAHAAGVVHRDLKPENLFLHHREDGTSIVKILDFGISKFLEDAPDGQRSLGLTKTGTILGTPLYMSTEQLEGRPVSARTDVWAVGLIAYFLLTGSSYWRTAHKSNASVMMLVAEITVNELEPPSRRAEALNQLPTWPPAFDAWFLQCVNRDPAARFGSVGEAIAALATALGAPAVIAPPTPRTGHAFDATVLGAQPSTTGSTGLAMAHTQGSLQLSATAQGPKSRALPLVIGGVVVCAVGAAALFLPRGGGPGSGPATAQLPADSASPRASTEASSRQPEITPAPPAGSASASAPPPRPARPAPTATPPGKRPAIAPTPPAVETPPKPAAPPDAYGAR